MLLADSERGIGLRSSAIIEDQAPISGMTQTERAADGTASSQTAGVAEILKGEYSTLFGALTATWQVSVARTTLLLGVGSAFSVAIGLAAQATAFGPGFHAFALVLLGVLLFLGLATYLRVVHAARESVVYSLGMNRIRAFFVRQAPEAAQYMVLPTTDVPDSIYHSPGSGMTGRPRLRLVHALVQLPGVVSVVNGVIAGAITTLVLGLVGAMLVTAVAISTIIGIGLIVLLLAYWQSSMADVAKQLAGPGSSQSDVTPRRGD